MNTRNFTLSIQDPELFRSWCRLAGSKKQAYSQITITICDPVAWAIFEKGCKRSCLNKQMILWRIFEKGLRIDLQTGEPRNPWFIIENGIREGFLLVVGSEYET